MVCRKIIRSSVMIAMLAYCDFLQAPECLCLGFTIILFNLIPTLLSTHMHGSKVMGLEINGSMEPLHKLCQITQLNMLLLLLVRSVRLYIHLTTGMRLIGFLDCNKIMNKVSICRLYIQQQTPNILDLNMSMTMRSNSTHIQR